MSPDFDMTASNKEKSNKQRKRRTRRKLIDAAATVFVRKGFHDTQIGDIVAQANLGQGTFYRYFKNKHDIYENLLDDFVARLMDGFSEMSLNPPNDINEYRDACIKGYGRFAETIMENRQMALMLLRETPAINEYFEQKMSRLIGQFAGLARFYLDHAIKSGYVRPCNSRIVAELLVGGGLRLVEQWCKGSFQDIPAQQIIQQGVDLIFFGFKPFES